MPENREPQYGEPWHLDDGTIWTASDEWMAIRGACGEIGIPVLSRIILCVNACAGLSDEQVREMRKGFENARETPDSHR